MQEVILDTSSMLFGIRNNKDAFQLVEEAFADAHIIVSRSIVKELEALAKTGKSEGREAKTALELMGKHNVVTVESTAYADSFIVDEARKRMCYVCTNDTELKKRLRAEGIRAFSIGRDGRLR